MGVPATSDRGDANSDPRRLERRYIRLEEGVPVLRCDDCHLRHKSPTYWPLTSEFWYLDRRGGLRRCRDCWKIEETAQMADRRKRGGEQMSVREAAYRRHYLERKRVEMRDMAP